MDIGMIGLGRMGSNMSKRLMRDGHRVVVYDLDPEAVNQCVTDGAVGATSVGELVAALPHPRVVWIMVPAAVVDRVLADLAPHLGPGDVVIDGGNSFYQDDIRRSKELAATGIELVDAGTSGGVFGLERGYCLMVGGSEEAVERVRPALRSLAPGIDSAPRTPGRSGDPGEAELGFLHCGPAGAGHFVKMVHNGIEYGVMAAYAEGLNILKHANAGTVDRAADAETAPLSNPEFYQYEFDIRDITELWRRGSVISSWLLDLTAKAFVANPELDGFEGRVSDSGEGRWTVLSAVETGVPAPVLGAALFGRFDSRDRDDFANQVLSAMRKEFGGHAEKAQGS